MAPRLGPLPLLDWDDRVRAALGVLLASDRINPVGAGNVLTTLVHNPPLTAAFLHFNNYVLRNSTLPERLREVAILRVSQLRECPYLWSHHIPIAHRAGLTDGDIAGIGRGEAGEPADRAVLAAIDELESQSRISDATWAALGEYLDENQRMDLVFAAGCYGLLAVVVNTYGIENES